MVVEVLFFFLRNGIGLLAKHMVSLFVSVTKITFVNYKFSWQAQRNVQEDIFKSHQIFTLHAF